MPSDLFPWLHLFSWLAVGYVAVFYMYGWNDWAYKVGKYAVVLMVGMMIGMGVV